MCDVVWMLLCGRDCGFVVVFGMYGWGSLLLRTKELFCSAGFVCKGNVVAVCRVQGRSAVVLSCCLGTPPCELSSSDDEDQ